jgi:exosome complex component RRP43
MVLCESSVADSKKLKLRGMPIAVTALVFKAKEQEQGRDKKHWILVDPDTFEEGLCDETVTVVVDSDHSGSGMTKLLSISKSGGTIVGKEEMERIVGLAEKRWVELDRLLGG